MVDFVKKKIVEGLARFTKHLDPKDISLSVLKGKGELNNLDLNADFITDVLRLPPWIRIKSVFCDQIKIDVPFTDLHKSPIRCMLHTVIIEVSTCDTQNEERESTAPTDLKKLSSSSSTSSYGMTEKIIDGMKVEIGCVQVKFANPVFSADLEMTDVVIESTTPEWKPDILPHCRYKNNDEGSVIIYKRCTWSSLKVEGGRVIGSGARMADPIRLLANTTEIRVTVKRRTNDCKVLYTRLSINLGDLSWVLTQEHLKSISLLVQSLTEAAVEWNKDERKKLALLRGSRDSLDSVGSSGSLASTASKEEDSKSGGKRSKSPIKDSSSTKNLKRETSVRNRELGYQLGQVNLPSYEVIQDSIHVKAGTVNLQLCDGKGSLLLHVKKLVIDIYLDQLATTGRCHWNKSNVKLSEATDWSSALVKTAEKVQYIDLPSINLYKLRERGIVVRCSDFKIQSEDQELLPIISCDNETFSLPNDLDNPAFQFVITTYFYPLEEAHKFLVPRPNVYAYLAPIHVNLHQQLFLWLAEFTHGVVRTVNLSLLLSASTEGKMVMEELKAKREVVQHLAGIDVKFYTPYTKVTLPSNYAYADDRPRALQVETGGINLQNHSLLSILSDKEFKSAWEKCRSGWLSNSGDQFPGNESDDTPMPDILVDLIETELKSQVTSTEVNKSTNRSNSLAHLTVPSSLSRNSSGRYSTPDVVSHHKISHHQLHLLAIETWHCHTRCVNLSFVSDLSHSATLYGTGFVSDFPLHVWLFQPKKIAEVMSRASSVPMGRSPPPDKEPPTVHVLMDIAQNVEVKMERLHFLFLMRLKDSFQGFKNKLMQYLTLDSLIETQNSEAFHVTKDTSRNGDEVFDETDESKQHFKDKISAAFKDGKSKESSVSSKESVASSTSSSLATASINCKGIHVTISLPSLGPILKSPKPESPVLSSLKSQLVSSETTPLSSIPSKPSNTDNKPPIQSPTSSSSLSEESDGFVLVMKNNTSSSSTSLSKSVSPAPMELIPEGIEATADESVTGIVVSTATISRSGVTANGGILMGVDGVGTGPNMGGSSITSSLQVPYINKPSSSLLSSSSQVSLLTPKHSLYVKTGQLKALLTLSDQGIALRTTVDTLHIDELTPEEISEMDRKKSSTDKHQSVEDVASPVIKARVELGKNVTNYFTDDGVDEFDIDGVVFLKISGLKVVLSMKNLMAVKDFFDDEKEASTPIPIQLRIIETQLVIKDQLSFPLVHPKNATVNVPDIFINRGPRAHGTNLVQSDCSSDGEGVPEGNDYHQPVVETLTPQSKPNHSLLESFQQFIEVFQAHTTDENASASKPDKASFLVKELGKTLSLTTPPSHSDALSCDFYSNVVSSSPHPTIDSLRAEVEALRTDNKKLQLELVGAREQYSDSLKEKDEVTKELIDAKVNLASAHLVMEQNLIKMERLYSENCTLKDRLGE